MMYMLSVGIPSAILSRIGCVYSIISTQIRMCPFHRDTVTDIVGYHEHIGFHEVLGVSGQFVGRSIVVGTYRVVSQQNNAFGILLCRYRQFAG